MPATPNRALFQPGFAPRRTPFAPAFVPQISVFSSPHPVLQGSVREITGLPTSFCQREPFTFLKHLRGGVRHETACHGLRNDGFGRRLHGPPARSALGHHWLTGETRRAREVAARINHIHGDKKVRATTLNASDEKSAGRAPSARLGVKAEKAGVAIAPACGLSPGMASDPWSRPSASPRRPR